MTTPRQALTQVLSDTSLAAYDLVPYARDLTPDRATIMIRVDGVTPTNDQLMRRYRFGLVLVTPRVDPGGPADDELDALLEDVLHVLDNTGPYEITWQTADRATYADARLPAYEITVTAYTTHTRGT